MVEGIGQLAGLMHDTFPRRRRRRRQEDEMPAVSRNQAVVARIAEHHPEDLYERNKGMASMSKAELHKMASTKTKGLPKKKGKYSGIGDRAR